MPRFVILEHRWNGVHWDLMLERGESLRTWALDAPIRPGAHIPARALGDHRLAYLNYEGQVSGGRGEVRRWDQGQYEVLEWTAERVRVRLEGDQLVGEAELRADVGGTTLGWVFRFGKAD
jgi:hypothetical protein